MATQGLPIPLVKPDLLLIKSPGISDLIATCLVLAIWAWFTDGWGLWAAKPDPLLFIPVRDRSAYEKLPKKSRNVAEALKVGATRIYI